MIFLGGKKMRELFEKYLRPPQSPKGDFDYVLLDCLE
jgi:hypothetical protein